MGREHKDNVASPTCAILAYILPPTPPTTMQCCRLVRKPATSMAEGQWCRQLACSSGSAAGPFWSWCCTCAPHLSQRVTEVASEPYLGPPVLNAASNGVLSSSQHAVMNGALP
eukprot:363049-Chlamydomonas_euryale.AAC.24